MRVLIDPYERLVSSGLLDVDDDGNVALTDEGLAELARRGGKPSPDAAQRLAADVVVRGWYRADMEARMRRDR